MGRFGWLQRKYGLIYARMLILVAALLMTPSSWSVWYREWTSHFIAGLIIRAFVSAGKLNELKGEVLGMAILTREQILGVNDIKTETISVPEWGGEVLVKALSGAERDQFEIDSLTGKGKNQHVNLQNIRARLVARTVVDETGARIFQDGDVKALGAKSAAALQRVFDAAQKLSGLTDDDIDELTENLEETPGDSSASA